MSTSYTGPSYNGASSQPSAGYAEPSDPYAATQPYGQGDYQGYAATPYSGQVGAVQPYSPYAAAPVLPEHPNAVMVLILGIISIVAVPLTGPFAWYFGSKARREVRENPTMYKESGMLTAGWVLGIIGSVLLVLYTIGVILYIIFFAVMFAHMPRG